jgi:cellulose synthase/poly-beta-1,6-N-acetylglucosamine synthase-like glycosyltransferase
LLDWPAELFRIVVIADNCTDRTSEEALRAGATVLARTDAENRGKGFALRFAFERLLEEGFADAFVVVDADSTASPNLLRAFQARIESGETCIQAEYGVRNPDASWRTRLMVIALALFHEVRSRAREKVGVSAGLRGNGMCFTAALLREIPHDAFSIVEDVEYGIRLGRAGRRVAYAHDALVLGEMVTSGAAATSQRRRWESGRFALARVHALPLLRDAFRTRNKMLFDLAMDLVVPPLSYLVVFAMFGMLSAIVIGSWWTAIPWLMALLLLGGYVLRGVSLAGPLTSGLRDLCWAPVYVVWKISLAMKRARSDEWVRTARESSKK